LRVSLAAFLRGISPVARLSLATAALLIVIGGSWLVTETLRLRAQVAQLHAERQSREQQERALEEQLAQQRQRSEDLAGGLQSEQQQRQRSEELIRELERQREESTAKPTGPSVVSFALLPGLARAGGTRPKLVLPQSSRLVRLQIGIEPGDEYKSFRVELYTQAAQQVWSQDNLSARAVRGGRAVVINLPAKLLGAGQYELALKGITSEGKNEALGYYYFDVLKKQ
jgi:TolA-binding protein